MPKVLLADDSTHAQRMGTKILAGEGIEVVTVSNGEAAVKKLDGEFDVVMADVFMPGRSGYELCTFIKNSPKYAHIPVVLVVGQLEPYDPEQGKKSRADGVLKKPFEATVVVETIRAMLVLAQERRPAPAPAGPPPPTAEEQAAEDAHEQREIAELAARQQITQRLEVPKDMEHAAAFDFLDEPAPGAEAAAPAAPAGSAYGVESSPGFSAYGAETSIESAAAPAETADVFPGTSAYDLGAVPEPSATGPSVIEVDSSSMPASEYGEPLIPESVEVSDEAGAEPLQSALEEVTPSAPALEGMPEFEAAAPAVIDFAEPAPDAGRSVVDLTQQEFQSAPPPGARPRRWVAEPEAVTDLDRALFGPEPALGAGVAGARAVESVPDWNDLLRSVEEAPAPPKSAPPVAANVAANVEADVAANAASHLTADVAADAAAPTLAAVATMEAPQKAAAVPAAARRVSVDPAEIRAGVEAGLAKGLPGMRPAPSVIEAVTREVLRRLGIEP